MRTTWLLLPAAFALVLSSIACDTQQPTDAGEQIITVTVRGTGTVDRWNIWDVWIDVDGNCEVNSPPDFEANFKFCEEVGITADTTVPWTYSAELAIIRAGTTTEELIATSIDTPNEFSNLSFYDEQVIQDLPDRPCSGAPNGLLSVNGRQLTAAHRDIMEGCLGFDNLLEANVLGQPEQYDVVVQQGDTVIFRSRKSEPGTVAADPYDDIVIGAVDQFGQMFIDGVEIEPQGNAATGDEVGGGISMSTRIR